LWGQAQFKEREKEFYLLIRGAPRYYHKEHPQRDSRIVLVTFVNWLPWHLITIGIKVELS
jgi:hypothetical protein